MVTDTVGYSADDPGGPTVSCGPWRQMALALCFAIIVTNSFAGRDGALCAQDPATKTTDEKDAPVVAATVDEVAILADEVELRVRQSVGKRKVTEPARALLRAEALEQLIDQQKVLVQLQRRGEACTEKELDVELRRLQDDMERQEKSLDDYCAALKISHASLRRVLQWRLSWKRCRDKYMTDDNLKRYFERHHKEFDGTTLRVAQVLLRPSPECDRQQCVARAKEIRDKIVAGTISFAEAARQFSQSPTARDGGQLDWIARQEPMPEGFSRAAFQLDVGEVSQPVVSPYGVHLIHCLEIKPGQKPWRQVRKPLSDAVSAYLFHWLADRPDPKHNVRYTGKSPHFQPGTRQLAERDGEGERGGERARERGGEGESG